MATLPEDLRRSHVTPFNRESVPEEQPVVQKPLRFGDRFRAEPRKWIAIGVGILLAIVAVTWAIRASNTAPPVAVLTQQDNPLVSVITPHPSNVASRVTFSGAIAARYDMPIGVEGEGGKITAIYVEAGDKVKKGQILARLDQSVLLPQVKRLSASLEEARAQAALSEAEFRRAQGVEAAGALSKEEIERRRAASVTDAARVDVAAAQLAEAQARWSHSEIRAPSDGIVLTRKAEIGQTVMAGGEALFRLAQGGEVEMRGQIAEQDLARLKVGQPAQIYLTGVAQPFTGSVRLLGAVIDPQTRLGDIRIALGTDPALRPGAFARGEVTVDQMKRPILPQTAVLSDAEGTYVYVVTADNKTERRPIHVIDTTPNGIVIGSGLDGDERVVATAGGFLRPGETVDVAPPKTASGQ